MGARSLDAVGRYDSLFLSTRSGDALVSCAARLHADRAKGLTALVLKVFEGPSFRSPRGGEPSPPGADALALDLPPAGRRDPRHRSFASSCFETFADDDDVRNWLTRVLADLRVRVRPRHVYAPLGVGGHVDRRIVCEAAIEAFSGEPGRNVFLYEDRPEALVPGEVRLRLGLLGARLPAGAVLAADRTGLLRHLARHRWGATLRGEGGGVLDWLRALRPGAAQWRAARAWNAQKAFGPRLQPVVHVADAEGVAYVRETAAALLPKGHGAARFSSQAAAYAQRLGAAGHAERYWLLLPRLDGGLEPAPDPEVV